MSIRIIAFKIDMLTQPLSYYFLQPEIAGPFQQLHIKETIGEHGY